MVYLNFPKPYTLYLPTPLHTPTTPYPSLHSYMHLISNMVFQLLIGLPLEMVHKFYRVGFVYTLGVIAG